MDVVSTAVALIAALAVVWTALFVMAASWLYRDAKEAAEVRRFEARMAAVRSANHREHQDHGRYGDPNRPE